MFQGVPVEPFHFIPNWWTEQQTMAVFPGLSVIAVMVANNNGFLAINTSILYTNNSVEAAFSKAHNV